jgi:hypothetical protein
MPGHSQHKAPTGSDSQKTTLGLKKHLPAGIKPGKSRPQRNDDPCAGSNAATLHDACTGTNNATHGKSKPPMAKNIITPALPPASLCTQSITAPAQKTAELPNPAAVAAYSCCCCCRLWAQGEPAVHNIVHASSAQHEHRHPSPANHNPIAQTERLGMLGSLRPGNPLICAAAGAASPQFMPMCSTHRTTHPSTDLQPRLTSQRAHPPTHPPPAPQHQRARVAAPTADCWA